MTTQKTPSEELDIDELLEAIFEKAYETGGDITFERQVQNEPEAYNRYKDRVISEAKAKITKLINEAYQQGYDDALKENGIKSLRKEQE